MPEASEFGWYSDWCNGGEGGPPMWETFHLTEVRELLERNWQAGEGSGRGRAVDGRPRGDVLCDLPESDPISIYNNIVIYNDRTCPADSALPG